MSTSIRCRRSTFASASMAARVAFGSGPGPLSSSHYANPTLNPWRPRSRCSTKPASTAPTSSQSITDVRPKWSSASRSWLIMVCVPWPRRFRITCPHRVPWQQPQHQAAPHRKRTQWLPCRNTPCLKLIPWRPTRNILDRKTIRWLPTSSILSRRRGRGHQSGSILNLRIIRWLPISSILGRKLVL